MYWTVAYPSQLKMIGFQLIEQNFKNSMLQVTLMKRNLSIFTIISELMSLLQNIFASVILS